MPKWCEIFGGCEEEYVYIDYGAIRRKQEEERLAAERKKQQEQQRLDEERKKQELEAKIRGEADKKRLIEQQELIARNEAAIKELLRKLELQKIEDEALSKKRNEILKKLNEESTKLSSEFKQLKLEILNKLIAKNALKMENVEVQSKRVLEETNEKLLLKRKELIDKIEEAKKETLDKPWLEQIKSKVSNGDLNDILKKINEQASELKSEFRQLKSELINKIAAKKKLKIDKVEEQAKSVAIKEIKEDLNKQSSEADLNENLNPTVTQTNVMSDLQKAQQAFKDDLIRQAENTESSEIINWIHEETEIKISGEVAGN